MHAHMCTHTHIHTCACISHVYTLLHIHMIRKVGGVSKGRSQPCESTPSRPKEPFMLTEKTQKIQSISAHHFPAVQLLEVVPGLHHSPVCCLLQPHPSRHQQGLWRDCPQGMTHPVRIPHTCLGLWKQRHMYKSVLLVGTAYMVLKLRGMSEEVHGLSAPYPLGNEGMAYPGLHAVWCKGLCFFEGFICQLQQYRGVTPIAW